MTDEDILKDIAAVIQDVTGDTITVIDMQTAATDVEGWDSMSHIIIVVALEAKFGIKLPMAALEDAKNVGDLIDLIKAQGVT